MERDDESIFETTMFLIFSTKSKLVSQLCLGPFASPAIGAVAPVSLIVEKCDHK